MEQDNSKNRALFSQVMAGVNAAYLFAIGLLSIFDPGSANRLYGVENIDSLSSALTRILAGGMVGAAVFLGAFAWKPERYSALAKMLLFQAVANTAGFLCVGIAGDLMWSQIARSLVAQILLVVALAFYLAKKRDL